MQYPHLPHLSQSTVNVIVLVWATGHDALFLGIYHLLTHFRLVRKHRSLDERVEALEKLHGIEV